MKPPTDYQSVLQLELALPPTLNQSYKIVHLKGSSRLALTEDADDYKDVIAILAFQALTEDFPIINGPRGGEYRFELTQHLNKNTRDVDANVKLVMDGICRGIGLNDNRVFEVSLGKRVSHRRYGKRPTASSTHLDPGLPDRILAGNR